MTSVHGVQGKRERERQCVCVCVCFVIMRILIYFYSLFSFLWIIFFASLLQVNLSKSGHYWDCVLNNEVSYYAIGSFILFSLHFVCVCVCVCLDVLLE